MAVMRPGPIGQMSGVLHGMEIARSGSQSVVKRQKIRQSSTSPARVHSQWLLNQATIYWQSLQAENKKAWNDAAKNRPVPDRFGQPRFLSGYQLFLTIPHDFNYGFAEQWLDLPPLLSTPDTGWEPILADPGPVMTGGPTLTEFEDRLVTLHVARFQSQFSDKSRKIWRRASFYYHPDFVDFSTGLADSNYYFIDQERIAVMVQSYTPGCWPIWHDYGTVLVEAHP